MQSKTIQITGGTAMLTVTAITVPGTLLVGATATITATITNSGSASGLVGVNFYVDGTLLSSQGTGTIAPGGSQVITINANTSTWAIGSHTVMAKTATE